MEPCLAAALGKAESVTITRLRTAKVRSVHLYRHGVFVLHLEGGGKAMFKPLPHDPFEMHAAPQFNELVATHIAFNLGMDNAPLSAIRNAPLHSLRDAISDKCARSRPQTWDTFRGAIGRWWPSAHSRAPPHPLPPSQHAFLRGREGGSHESAEPGAYQRAC